MPARPIIGIPMQTQNTSDAFWVMRKPYVDALRNAGAIPWVIPLLADDPETLREIFDRLDGLFLAGGADVSPTRYGEAAKPYLGATDPERDAVETAFVRMSLDARLPIFAVCRGLQLLNVACGGSLHQDIRAEVPAAIKHDYFAADLHIRTACVHDIAVKAGTRIADIFGSASLSVNSMHHQAIKELAPNLIASAFAPDGIIEAVEAKASFAIGVQWHPEELAATDPAMRRLFEAFTAAATEGIGP